MRAGAPRSFGGSICSTILSQGRALSRHCFRARVGSRRNRCFSCRISSVGQRSDGPAVMSQGVVTGDPGSLEKKISAIREAGTSKLQVIADFDGTLTKYRIHGCRGQTSHGLLQQGNPEYDARRHALYEYYHPLEISPSIPIEEKTKLMEEWWEKTHGLLIEGGLTFDAIKESVTDATIAFRDGVVDLFQLLEVEVSSMHNFPISQKLDIKM